MKNGSKVLSPKFYLQDTKTVAQKLLGKILVRRLETGDLLKGRIIETEAYLGLKDPACHSYHGKKTKRVEPLYLSGGHAYVYLIYGMHYCLNVVTRSEKFPEAVLLRGIEMLDPSHSSKKLISGPGRLAKTMQIDLAQNGVSFMSSEQSDLWIEEPAMAKNADDRLLRNSEIQITARIGLGSKSLYSKDWALRFLLK